MTFGMGSFSFESAQVCLARGFLPDVISSDVNALCIGGPAYDLPTTMSKLLSLGMSLERVIAAATAAPARAISRSDLGTLRPGSPADVTVLDDRTGRLRVYGCHKTDDDGTPAARAGADRDRRTGPGAA